MNPLLMFWHIQKAAVNTFARFSIEISMVLESAGSCCESIINVLESPESCLASCFEPFEHVHACPVVASLACCAICAATLHGPAVS